MEVLETRDGWTAARVVLLGHRTLAMGLIMVPSILSVDPLTLSVDPLTLSVGCP